MKLFATNTAKYLNEKLEELNKLEDQRDILKTFVDNCGIKIKNGDNAEEDLSVSVNALAVDTQHYATKDELTSLITALIDNKRECKAKFREEDKIKASYAGAGFGFTGKREVVALNTVIIKKNTHDYDLFSNFRQCGSSLVLKEGDQILLCVENGKGQVYVNPQRWLKGEIGEIVKAKFESKVRQYLKKMNDFVQEMQDMSPDESGIAPIEDFLSTEVPSSMHKFFDLVDQVETKKIGTGKNSTEYTIHHYSFQLKQKIENFDDLFKWTLDNWGKFRGCIHGEAEFYAWSNDREFTAASYWMLPTEDVKCPKSWQDFLKAKMSTHFTKRLVSYLGMICDAKNRCQQYLLIFGKGGEGKDFFERILSNTLPKNAVSNLDTSALANDDRFGLANREIWKSHVSIIHELNSGKNIQTEKAKQYFAQNSMDLEVKNAGVVTWNPINHKTIINSNTKISIKEKANRRRCIPIVFSNKLSWSQELEDQMTADCKQFLDFCYNFYKSNKLVKNGEYLVLSEEDEVKYINGTLNLDDEDDDLLSKRAFCEDSLKDYCNTDEYTDSDSVWDVYEPIINEMMTITNDSNDKVTNTDFLDMFRAVISNNINYMSEFGTKLDNNNQLYNFYPNKNTDYWKFRKYLEDRYSVKCKTIRSNGETMRGWSGIKLKKKPTFSAQTVQNDFAANLIDEEKVNDLM